MPQMYDSFKGDSTSALGEGWALTIQTDESVLGSGDRALSVL